MASYWKILTGVAVGVGAVAAAPFTGGGSVLAGASLLGSLAGAGTIAAAVGMGVAGGVAGAVISESDEEDEKKKINRARREGAEAGKAATIKEYSKKMDAFSSLLEEHQIRESHLIGLFAVGMAVAACNNVITEEQEGELRALVAGIDGGSLPQETKDLMRTLRENPPSFPEAMVCAAKYGINADIVDKIIVLMAEEDGVVDEYEQAFIDRWHGYRPEYERMVA